MKKLRRSLQNCTNQIGRGNGQEQPTFEIVRPPEDNYFNIEVKQSKSFKQSHAARQGQNYDSNCCCFCFCLQFLQTEKIPVH